MRQTKKDIKWKIIRQTMKKKTVIEAAKKNSNDESTMIIKYIVLKYFVLC